MSRDATRIGTECSADVSDGGQTDKPIPVRFWWLKRFVVLGAAFLVALFGLRMWWGHVAGKRLDAQIAEYRAAGELVYAEEFDAQLDAVADQDNAAILYEQAIAKIVHATTSGVRYEDFFDDRSLFDSNPDAAKKLYESNAEVLKLVRQARGRPQVAWSFRLGDWVGGASSGLLSGQRSLARLLSFATSFEHHGDDHAAAVATLQYFLDFSQDIADHPTLISHLVSWACTAIGTSWIEDHAAGIRVAGRSVQVPEPRGTVDRAQIGRMIRSLLDEEPAAKALQKCYLGERSLGIVFHKQALSGTLWSTFGVPAPVGHHQLDWMLAPLLELDMCARLRLHTRLALASRESSSPGAVATLQMPDYASTLLGTLVRPLFEIERNAYTTSMRIYFQHLANRRMAATALAIRLYVVDHGRRPLELNGLVPEYLPSVPLDPFSSVDAPIKYRLEPEPAMLYSIGADGTDDGGESNKRADIVFYLDGRPDKDVKQNSTRSPQAGDGDQDVKDGERKSDAKKAYAQ